MVVQPGSLAGRRPLRHPLKRIVVRGAELVSVSLTPEAYSLGLALALPERIPCSELARPTGVGRALATCEITIEGRDQWLAAAGLTA